MDELSVQHLSLFVLTIIYMFSFRESVKSTALWGAFEFGKTGFFHRKILCSAIVLILFPLSMYFFFSRIAFILPQSNLMRFLAPVVRILIMSIIILLLGLFPRATKHFWSYIARTKAEQGTNKDEPGYGWFNSAIDMSALPHKWYSVQVIIIMGILPLSILLIMAISRSVSVAVDSVFLLKLYSTLYISQFFVLYPISKKRGYYKHEPQWLLSRRIILTYPTTILIPMALGIAVSPLLLKFTSTQNWLPAICSLAYLVFVVLPFPYCCHQSWLIIARKNEWGTKIECPEMYEGKGTIFWYLCLLLSFLALFIYVALYLFADIGYDLMWDRVESFTF